MTFPRVIFFLIVVLVCVLLVAGCDDKYPIQSSSLAIVKLSSDGSLVWTKNIDRATANYATDIIQTSDGGYAIPGSIVFEECIHVQKCQAHPRLIRIDGHGQLLWDRIINESSSNGVQTFQNSDGSYTLVSSDGVFWTLDNSGKILKNQSSGVNVGYITRTSDGGYILIDSGYGNSIITKLDQEAGITWNRTFPNESIESVNVIVEMDDDLGYLAPAFGNLPRKGPGQLFMIQIDRNGSLVNKTWLESIPGQYSPGFAKNPIQHNYLIWYSKTLSSDGSQMYAISRSLVQLNKKGEIVNRSNQSIPGTVSLLNDGGLIAVGFTTDSENTYADIMFGSDMKDKLIVMKRNPDGTGYWKKEWAKKIPSVVINYPLRIIQTSDGGYAILGRTDR